MKHIMWELGFRSHDLARLPVGARALILADIDRLIRIYAEHAEEPAQPPQPRKGCAKVIQLFPGQSGGRS